MTAPETQKDVSAEQEALDHQFMSRAMELARKAEALGEIPVGAVVVHNGEVIGEGFNLSITSNDPSAHAEMIAIREAGQYLNNYRLIDCTLYVTLEPCPMCAGLLVHSRISRLVFATTDMKTGSAGSVFNLVDNENLNHQVTVCAGIQAEECSQRLSAFFQRRRKEKKQQKKANKLNNANNK